MTDHVTNKDLSIKLKEAGFEQESEFYWGRAKIDREIRLFIKIDNDYIFLDTRGTANKIAWDFYFAYFATELLKWLPGDKYAFGKFGLLHASTNSKYWCCYQEELYNGDYHLDALLHFVKHPFLSLLRAYR